MAGTVLWCDQALLPEGWARHVRITVAQGRIVSVTPDAAPQPDDEHHAIVLPGLGNLHSHAFQRVIAGLTEKRGPSADSFWSWRSQMYRFQTRIGPEDMRIIAALAYMEMLETGFTRVGEFHYLHHAPDGTAYDDPAEMAGAVCAAARDTGIGLTLLPVFYAHSGFGGQPPHEGQARFIHAIDGFARLLDACRAHLSGDMLLGIAPHSLRAVTPEELKALLPLCPDGPVHIHIAEQVAEVEQCLAHFAASPVRWLLDNVPVDERWCLVHATHMTPEETAALAASGAVAGLCPITEANLGDGVFPAEAFLEAGGVFGIGSDSNVLINAAEELRLLEYSQRLAHRARNVLAAPEGSTGARLFSGAMAGGARALCGAKGLAQKAAADMVSLEAAHPSLAGKRGDDVLDAYVFAGNRPMIDTVWRQGRKRVRGGRHEDRERIVAAYASLMQRLSA